MTPRKILAALILPSLAACCLLIGVGCDNNETDTSTGTSSPGATSSGNSTAMPGDSGSAGTSGGTVADAAKQRVSDLSEQFQEQTDTMRQQAEDAGDTAMAEMYHKANEASDGLQSAFDGGDMTKAMTHLRELAGMQNLPQNLKDMVRQMAESIPGGAAVMGAMGGMPGMGGTTPPTGGMTPPAGGTTPPAGGTTPPAGGTTPPAGGTTPPAGNGGMGGGGQ